MENEKMFLRVKSINDRRILCGILAENGYIVSFGQHRVPGKKSNDYGVFIEDRKGSTANEG